MNAKLTDSSKEINLTELRKKMLSYVVFRLGDMPLKQLEGYTPEDFVQDAFCAAYEGKRKWETANTQSLQAFYFMTLRSIISHYQRDRKNRKNVSIIIEPDDYDL